MIAFQIGKMPISKQNLLISAPIVVKIATFGWPNGFLRVFDGRRTLQELTVTRPSD